MTEAQKESFKKSLEEKRDALKKKIEEYSKEVDLGNDIEDPESEEADEVEEFSNNLSIANAYRAQLEEIENALHKMGGESYGVCEKCGGKISLEKLAVDSAARHCISCEG